MLMGLSGCQTTVDSGASPSLAENDEEQEELRVEEDDIAPTIDGSEQIPNLGQRIIFGWVEWVCVKPENIAIKAKLDSGARTSSMNAQNLTEFERDGETWVRFKIDHPETGEPIEMEQKVVRFLRIVQHDRESQRRPVVELEVKLGDIHQKAEFSLVDRSNFVYQILIGRNYLKGLGLIDSEETFLAGNPCE